MKKIIALLMACVLIVLPLSACAEDTSTEVTDARGKVIKFDKVPEKIICLSPADVEVLYELGLGSKIIGVSEFSNYPADTANKTVYGTADNTSIEALIDAAPDVIIIDKMAQTPEQVDQLDASGIPVIVVESATIEQCYTKMAMLGNAFGKQDAAKKMIDGIKAAIDEIKLKVSSHGETKVYYEISPLEMGLWTCGKGTFQDEILTTCGFVNIFADTSTWAAVSEEQVIDRNPDVIFSTCGSYSSPDGTALTEISARANWGTIEAVKSGKVIDVNEDIMSRAGPRLGEAAKALYDAVYGG